MSIKRILVSQPRPTTEKSPYFDLEKKYGVEISFRPFFKVEGLTSKEFRQSKINIPDYSAIIMTARTAVDHFFRLSKELRYNVPSTLKYFCVSETIAHYLQKYVEYRKRKIFYSENGLMDGLVPIIKKHHKETYLMPVSESSNDKLIFPENSKVKYTKAVMYRTVSTDIKPEELSDFDMLVFFTPVGIKAYATICPDYKERKVAVGAMGKGTLDAATELGINVDATTSPNAPSMASAIEQYIKKALAEEEKAAKAAARKAAAKKKAEAEAKPAAKKATAAKKAEAKPAAKKAETKPAAKKATATKKAEAKPAAKKATATKKAETKPAAKKTTATKKAEAKPAAKKTTATKKAEAKPAAKKATATKKAQINLQKAEAKPAAKKATATKKTAVKKK